MDGRREVVEKGLIAIKNDGITYVGREIDAPPIRAEKTIDGHGKVAAPGLVN